MTHQELGFTPNRFGSLLYWKYCCTSGCFTVHCTWNGQHLFMGRTMTEAKACLNEFTEHLQTLKSQCSS